MENNNEIMNEDVIETTEEIVKTSSGNGFGKVALAMIAGGLLYKFAVEPAAARFKERRKTRQAIPVNCDNENGFEGDIVENSEE